MTKVVELFTEIFLNEALDLASHVGFGPGNLSADPIVSQTRKELLLRPALLYYRSTQPESEYCIMIDRAVLEEALHITEELETRLKAEFDTVALTTTAVTRPAYGEIEGVSTARCAFAVEFRRQLCLRNQSIREYFTWNNQEYRLTLFPSLVLEACLTGDYDTSGASFIRNFERERRLLEEELCVLGRRVNTDERELGRKLREARRVKGETLEEASGQIGCAVSTISRIERNRQATSQYAESIRAYILKT